TASPPRGFAVAVAELASRHYESQAALAATLAERRQQLDGLKQEEAALAPRVAELRRLAAVARTWRFWSAAWREARPRRAELNALAALETKLLQARAPLVEVEPKVEHRSQAQAEAEQASQDARRRCLAAETARRQAEIDDQLAALQRERGLLHEKAH